MRLAQAPKHMDRFLGGKPKLLAHVFILDLEHVEIDVSHPQAFQFTEPIDELFQPVGAGVEAMQCDD